MSTQPPDPQPKRQRRKDDRPGEIVIAALSVFAEAGFNSARMEDVASAAQVSKGTVFRYFASKNELFKAVVHAYLGPRLTTWRELVNTAEGPTGELLEALMLQWWRDTGSTPAAAISRIFIQEARHIPDVAEYYEQTVIQPGRDILHSILERGVRRKEFRSVDLETVKNLAMAPLLLLAMTHHDTIARSMVLPANQDPEQLISNMAQLLVSGLHHPTENNLENL